MNTGKASIELKSGKYGQVYTDGWVSTQQGSFATIQFYEPLTGKRIGEKYVINREDVVKFTWGS